MGESGLGEHQRSQAGNLMSVMWTRAMCALWAAPVSNGADGANGTGGIVNICQAHVAH